MSNKGFLLSVECLNCGSFNTELGATTEGIKAECKQCNQVGTVYYDKSITELSRMASEMGKVGGTSKSEAKSNASRENGKKGGRPKKAIAQTKKEEK